MRSAALTWIEPGASATLIWHGATAAWPGEGRPCHLPGPAFEPPPARALFMPESWPIYVTADAHAVRVSVLIHNDAGVWTCWLHPFEFAKETA